MCIVDTKDYEALDIEVAKAAHNTVKSLGHDLEVQVIDVVKEKVDA